MSERILDIVVYMASRLRDEPATGSHPNEMASDLESQGFTSREVSSAYSWMFDRYGGDLSQIAEDGSDVSKATRVFSPREMGAFSSEAAGFLSRLVVLNILSHSDFEELIEACVQAGRDTLSIEDVKMIVSGALFSSNSSSPFGTVDSSTPADESWLIN